MIPTAFDTDLFGWEQPRAWFETREDALLTMTKRDGLHKS
jgi:hypothetical protein